MGARFPYSSYPRGWFVVGFTTDVAAGEVKTVHHFGQDIVLFRTATGRLAALDRMCPHLGAHLGAGRVDGECLRCPFHDWAFDGTGRCVEVPGVRRIPAKASVSAWPLRERDGVVLVWHCPQGTAPTWEPPLLADEGWTATGAIRREIEGHPQELAELAVDGAHLKQAHHAISAELRTVELDGHRLRVRWHMTGDAAESPVELDVTLHGPGVVVSTRRAAQPELRARQRLHATPIDGQRIAIFAVTDATAADPGHAQELDEGSHPPLADLLRRFTIWRARAYLERPQPVGDDGPVDACRRWARQFYVAAASEPATAQRASEQRGALVRLGAWLRDTAGADEAAGAAAEPSSAGSTPAARASRFTSVEAYFETLADRFDGEAAGDLEAVFQWVLTGDGAQARFAAIKDGAVALARGTHASPTVTIEMSAADYLALINGELSGARAFSTGRGRLRGPVRLAMRMPRLFPRDRVVQ
ncbi:MAG: Rieske 2Fe-2S domain-containing protein [Myxococcales bacterium]|nr:Rieske 2Fe-2S domain-containing protein [Myxococcales bacterium]